VLRLAEISVSWAFIGLGIKGRQKIRKLRFSATHSYDLCWTELSELSGHTHTHTHTHTCTYVHIHTQTYAHTYTHINTHTYTQTHTHTYTHKHTHTYTHTHTHTQTHTFPTALLQEKHSWHPLPGTMDKRQGCSWRTGENIKYIVCVRKQNSSFFKVATK
jgi:hypothetical protein